MAVHVRWLVALCLFSIGPSLAWSADPAPAQESGPQGAEFDRLFTDWKGILNELRQLREDFQKASPERQGEMEKRYEELMGQGEKMLPRLVAVAEGAFLEAPRARPDLAEFLMGVTIDSCYVDAYEEGFRLTKLLIDNGFEHPMLHGWGGIAAFNVAEFDLAEKWLRVAKERNILSRLGREVEGLGETCLIDMAFAKGAWKKEQAIRQTEAKASTPETWLPRVLLRTSKGDIELELFENEAPNTVANFISLVERGYYNGTVFHRVIEHFMAQGGVSPGGRGADIGYTIPCECYQPNYRVHFRGSLSMALPADGRDKGSNQFFLTFRPTHHLDGKHTCFGRVVKGMEVLSKLQRIVPERMDTGEPDKILEAKVLRKRKHPYEPKKLVRGS